MTNSFLPLGSCSECTDDREYTPLSSTTVNLTTIWKFDMDLSIVCKGLELERKLKSLVRLSLSSAANVKHWAMERYEHV